MAYKTVANLKDSVSAILQGLNLNNVRNLHGAFERTARILSQKIEIPDVMGRYNLSLYDGVINYLSPTDIFGSALIDIQPQGITRNANDFVYKKFISDFDRLKNYLPNGTEVTFEWNKGVAIARIVSTRPIPKIELDTMAVTTGWTAAGSASGLTEDDTVFYQEPSSLRFTLTGASTGTLTKTIPQVDLTKYVGVGVVFLAIKLPSANAGTDLTSISIKIGSTSGLATNYYSASATSGFLGSWTVGEFLIVAIDLATATTVGTPVPTAIKYVQLSFVHGATMTNVYVGDLWISLPSPHTLIYKTAAIFQVSGSNPSSSISTVADSVILNDNAYAIYEQECAMTIASQQGGDLASGIINQISNVLNGVKQKTKSGIITVQPGLLDLYRGDNPSQMIRTVGNWYDD